jgi:4,5-DOPA dioxygenase extradiol
MSVAPVLYLSHGAPRLADDPVWPGQLAAWSARLPRPKAILIVSAHWEEAPLTLAATTTVPLIYDFYGLPERYYQVTYPAPGAPELAEKVRGLLRGPGLPVRDAPERGLDHGAWVPLTKMYPDADIPVLQVSMPSLDPGQLYEVGRKLRPLRDEGVLIIGSGFFTHNLRQMLPVNAQPHQWAVEFDQWGAEALQTGDLDALLDFEHRAPAAQVAHPRTEHFAPLFVALGAGSDESPETMIEGFWHGCAKRSVQFG